MNDSQTSARNSFSTENDQIDGYKRLSKLAVWSVPLGLGSALAMVSPLLWFVPVVGVAFALSGLLVISRSNDITGRRLAIAGLIMAVLFGTWGVSWTVSRQVILNRQARQHAVEWLALLRQQQYMQAHQLGKDFFERLPTGVSLEDHYADREVDTTEMESKMAPGMEEMLKMSPGMNQTPFKDLNEFKKNGVVGILVGAKGEFDFEFVKNLTQLRDGDASTKVDQLFRITFADDHEPRAIDVKIELKRTVDVNKAFWKVGPMSEANSPS